MVLASVPGLDRREYLDLAAHIAASLTEVPPEVLPVRMYVAGGAARLLYFDRQYSHTLGLMHGDAQEDSILLELDGIDPRVLEVRILTPTDLAVSKLGRYSG